ncbi:MAG: ribonuclease III domain-containing protein, partial [Sphingomonas sp.]
MAEPDLHSIIGYIPADAALFTEALTHGSHSSGAGGRDYQRLEFLGDRVLGLVIAVALYAAFPGESEGQLSARLNALVTRDCCAEVARAI